jgi:hypothetical protein
VIKVTLVMLDDMMSRLTFERIARVTNIFPSFGIPLGRVYEGANEYCVPVTNIDGIITKFSPFVDEVSNTASSNDSVGVSIGDNEIFALFLSERECVIEHRDAICGLMKPRVRQIDNCLYRVNCALFCEETELVIEVAAQIVSEKTLEYGKQVKART